MKYIVLFVFLFSISIGYAQVCTTCPSNCSSGCTVTVSANSSTDYSIGAGEKLCITGGTYTGDITFTAATGTVCVSGTAAFNPASLDAGLGDEGTIQIGPTATATFGAIAFGSSRSLIINNCGSITHTGNMTRTGSGTFKYYNSGTLDYGSNTFDFSGTSGANVFCNNGTVTGGTLTLQGVFTNYAAGNITLTTFNSTGSGDVFNNDGIITVSGTTTISGGGTLNICNGGHFTTGNLSMSGSSKIDCSGTCGQMTVIGTSSFTGTSGARGNVDICDGSGTAPTRLGTSADPKVDSNSGTTIFDATVGYCSCSYVLPIELVGFRTDCNNEKVDLYWSTATETNNDFFTVERTDNGIIYETIAIIDSKAPNGNSTQTISYSFTDNSFPKEALTNNKVVYYRLKQTDLDGTFTYSNILPASCTNYCIEDVLIIADNNDVFINIRSVCSAVVDISIYNTLGQIVSVKRADVTSGENHIQLSSNDISSGLYILKAETTNQNLKKKFIKQSQ